METQESEMQEKKGPDHYRFVESSGEDGVRILCEKYVVTATTPQGYWVVRDYYASWPESSLRKYRRWVSKDSYKRYCYPSKEEAFHSYVRRKQKHVQHARFRLAVAEQAEAKAMELEEDKELIANFPLGYSGVSCGRPGLFSEYTWE